MIDNFGPLFCEKNGFYLLKDQILITDEEYDTALRQWVKVKEFYDKKKRICRK